MVHIEVMKIYFEENSGIEPPFDLEVLNGFR